MNQDFDHLSDELERGKEAIYWMRLAMTSSLASFIAQIIGFIQGIKGNKHWWIMLLLGLVAFILARVFEIQAARIYPEGFRHDHRR